MILVFIWMPLDTNHLQNLPCIVNLIWILPDLWGLYLWCLAPKCWRGILWVLRAATWGFHGLKLFWSIQLGSGSREFGGFVDPLSSITSHVMLFLNSFCGAAVGTTACCQEGIWTKSRTHGYHKMLSFPLEIFCLYLHSWRCRLIVNFGHDMSTSWRVFLP